MEHLASSYRTSGETQNRLVGQFNIDEITPAPLRKTKKVRLNVKPSVIFKKVNDYTGLAQWMPMIRICTMDNSLSECAGEDGVGSVLTCSFGPNIIEGKVVMWDPPYLSGYLMTNNGLPITDHLSVFSIEHDRIDHLGGSIVTWRQYFNIAKTAYGMFMPVIMGEIMNKAFDNLIDEFGGEMLRAREER